MQPASKSSVGSGPAVAIDHRKLAVVKAAHTLIYAIMAGATLYVLYCGIAGRSDGWLLIALGLVTVEGVVFATGGMRCPLTALAQKHGDPKGYVGDTFFPERCTRYTFRAFGTLYAVGLVLLAANYMWR